MLACAICGVVTVVLAQAMNWFLIVTADPPTELPNEVNENFSVPRKLSETSSADGSMNGSRGVGMLPMSVSGAMHAFRFAMVLIPYVYCVLAEMFFCPLHAICSTKYSAHCCVRACALKLPYSLCHTNNFTLEVSRMWLPPPG
jgi:hypothetical protein